MLGHGLDQMLKDAVRGRFGVLMAWSVDRLGRSLQDLLHTLNDLRAANCDLVPPSAGAGHAHAIRPGDVSDARCVCRIRTRDDPGTRKVRNRAG